MIVADANFFLLLIEPSAMPQIPRGAERVEHFIRTLATTGEEVMIPAPAIAELVAGRIDRVETVVGVLHGNRSFIVQPFDEVIAIETGILIRRWIDGVPLDQRPPGWKAAMKYDAQIAATAIVRQARAICTDDGGYEIWTTGSGVEIVRIADLPLPPTNPQDDMFGAPEAL